MPIYEFRCRKCKAVNEFLVRGAGLEAGTACPACGGANLEKMMSAAAIATRGGSAAAPGASGGKKNCRRPSCSGCGGRCHH